jgi:RimJ/RimL family protein N-acetyltransferase
MTGPSKSIEESQHSLARNHLPISEHEGDVRKYRASYSVYMRSPNHADESQCRSRDPSRFIGRVGARECLEYGAPFPDSLTIPKDVLEKGKILQFEVGYSFLENAWGKGYATEAMKALVAEYVKPRGFWNPPFERVYLLGVAGCANVPSRRVLEKVGFRLNGIHRWEGPDVFIGGAMQPPEVCVYSLDPSAIDGELHDHDNP